MYVARCTFAPARNITYIIDMSRPSLYMVSISRDLDLPFLFYIDSYGPVCYFFWISRSRPEKFVSIMVSVDQSEISKQKELKEECVKFKSFLDKLTPAEWRGRYY